MEKLTNLKKTSLSSLKASYWRLVSVCFLIAMLTSAYPASTTFFGFHKIAHSSQTHSQTENAEGAFSSDRSNSEEIEQTVENYFSDTFLMDLYQSSSYMLVNTLVEICSTSMSAFFAVLRIFNNVRSGLPLYSIILMHLGVLLSLLYMIFVNNILLIGEKRFFMEIRNYPHTNISKIFYLFKLNYVMNPSWIMMWRTVFQSLWNLTIVGGVIKHYEYCLIPYIIAENPRITMRNAFFLSRQMTKGNKMQFFLLDLSFVGWFVLSFFTLGFLDFVFVNPYRTACHAELYMGIRRNYVLSRMPGYEYLNDSYLEHVPYEDELLINKALYDDSEGPYTKISYFEPEQYPAFLFSIQPPVRAVRTYFRIDRHYDALSYIFLFHMFSVFGWLLETTIGLVRTGAMPERHLFFGPWLPLYGIYGILLLTVMGRLLRKPALVFLASLGLYSALEYLSSWLSEVGLGIRLRDYSGYFLNLNGRIYLEGSVTFALIGCAFLYYLAPRWADFFAKLKKPQQIAVCILGSLIAVEDVFVTMFIDFLAK